MSNRTIVLNDALYEYMLSVSLREPDVLSRLREETAKMPQHNMQISPEQGQFMALLVELTGARKCLEVGTFTGYSALSVALALGTWQGIFLWEHRIHPHRRKLTVTCNGNN